MRQDYGDIIEVDSGDHILKLSNYTTWVDYLENKNEKMDEEIRSKTRKGMVLGSESFIDTLEIKSGRILSEKQPGRPKK